jgi:F0F1-type ATP synthase assembly protein I
VSPSEKSTTKTRKELFNTALISITGSVGCLTVGILLGAVFGGMWLDEHFGTTPTWTLILVLASIPLSVIAMVFVARVIIKRIQPEMEKDQKKKPAEENLSSGS